MHSFAALYFEGRTVITWYVGRTYVNKIIFLHFNNSVTHIFCVTGAIFFNGGKQLNFF